MKKSIFIALLICCAMMIFSGVKANAKIPAGLFLPDGENYLNPENIYYTPTDGDYEGYLTSRKDIMVKENTTYYIYCIHKPNVCFDGQTIKAWDDITEDLVEIESDDTDGVISFTTDLGVDRVSIEFCVVNVNRDDNYQIWDVGANYVMAEAGTVDVNHLSNYPFAGYSVNGTVVSTDTVKINTVESNPITYNRIINNLYVYDFTDNILNNSKIITKNTYENSGYLAGDYEIDVTVKNNGTWKQTISNADASTMDHDAQNRITVADSKKYNNTWYN